MSAIAAIGIPKLLAGPQKSIFALAHYSLSSSLSYHSSIKSPDLSFIAPSSQALAMRNPAKRRTR